MIFNKKFFASTLIILQLATFTNSAQVLAKSASDKTKQESKINLSEQIDLNLNDKDKPSVKINEPKKLEGSLSKEYGDNIKQAFEIQKKKDVEDITALWEATVERNQIIKFAVKKLAMPPEQRRIHSSLMAKSVSALISGASIMPGLFGADSAISSASTVSGSLINRIIKNKTLPKNAPITDTELIQLAGLIENLQNQLIKNYYNYKSSLEALQLCRKELITQNESYSDALNSNNEFGIIISSAMYDKQLLEETKIMQDVKLHRIELERLAGTDAVAGLNLIKINQVAFENQSKQNESKQTEEVKNETH